MYTQDPGRTGYLGQIEDPWSSGPKVLGTKGPRDQRSRTIRDGSEGHRLVFRLKGKGIVERVSAFFAKRTPER